ncbi:MAG: hypothetical protein KatS3mg013_1014 [Actinomycetota bacterium]|jgi:hypothetical protein|nr:MAG: hypothetical protein KatS3mg013_1014 [Actinomycetota bacterium]
MDRRTFLKRSALVGATLAAAPNLGLDSLAATRRNVRWGALCLPRSGQRDQIEAVQDLEAKVGRRFDTTHYRLRWELPLVNDFTRWSVRTGHTPIISWFTRKRGGGMVSWEAIARGEHDEWITKQARSLKDAGWRGYFCFHKEPENEGNAQDWKAAHDRVYQIFHNVGVRFRFVATLTAYTFAGGNGGAGAWLPPRYDVIGVDGYNRYRCTRKDWRNFSEIFSPAREVARRRGKNLYIVEYGSTEGGSGQKADWIHNARRAIKDWPEVVGCSYNHEHTDCLYYVDSSSSALKAFREMGADPTF